MAKVTEKIETTRKQTITLVMALVNKILNEIGIVKIINEHVEWNKEHWSISIR